MSQDKFGKIEAEKLTWASLNLSLHSLFFFEEATEPLDLLLAELSSEAVLSFFGEKVVFWVGVLIWINIIQQRG